MKLLMTAIICAAIGSAAYATVPTKNLTLTVVNSGDKTICVYGENAKHCIARGSKEFTLPTQTFYKRSGVIRISVNGKPAVIGMIKNDIATANLYFDQHEKLHLTTGTFEPGSFEYSNNMDYLQFVVKPNYLFTEYPA